MELYAGFSGRLPMVTLLRLVEFRRLVFAPAFGDGRRCYWLSSEMDSTWVLGQTNKVAGQVLLGAVYINFTWCWCWEGRPRMGSSISLSENYVGPCAKLRPCGL
ncbi:hypothetical protein LOK49_LG07G01269 [Camellia lanceoleosa]|uniref:Uncharacterized protein n=1 Tax=Camellia lanceoleosa TaxID=1840588 RepID=A0ACC0H5A3_9ERIC|nr:hypothetical protein LOK49_LG07G01269 [Camellia lanceoleosa]